MRLGLGFGFLHRLITTVTEPTPPTPPEGPFFLLKQDEDNLLLEGAVALLTQAGDYLYWESAGLFVTQDGNNLITQNSLFLMNEESVGGGSIIANQSESTGKIELEQE